MHRTQVSVVTGILILLVTLANCQSRPYSPSKARAVQDRWDVVVAQDGLVQVKRSVLVDATVAVYLRNSSLLEDIHLFGEVEQQVVNDCEPPQDHGGVMVLNCSTAYYISAMPTQLQAILNFPDDLLPSFVISNLAYQPVVVKITREVDVSVPGKLRTTVDDEIIYFPVYASQSNKTTAQDLSYLRLVSELILAPGDLVQPAMHRLDSIKFEPTLGMP